MSPRHVSRSEIYIILILLLIGLISCLIVNCSSTKFQQYPDSSQAEIAKQAESKALERGKQIWFDANTGTNGRSCESCHQGGDMTRAENYPRYKHILHTMATLSMTHNFAVVNESKGKPWELGSYDANALVLYVTSLANGKSIAMAWPQEYRDEWVNRGRAAFADTGIGTNSKSCANCHLKDGKQENIIDDQMVPKLVGTAATYPRYNFELKQVITLEQQVNYCLEKNLQGSPLPLDDKTIVALCCYLTWLSEGKKISVLHFK